MNQDWIDRLISDGEPESATLDFKRLVPERDLNGMKSSLTDVAALANARGGRIVYGLAQDSQGRAKKIFAVTGNVDSTALWIQTNILEKIFPRIAGVEVQPVHHAEGPLIVVNVPRQYGGPYQASVSDWMRFPIRAGIRNVDMSYQQLYEAFVLKSAISQRAQDWMEERRKALMARATNWNSTIAVMHLVPFSAFNASERPDISVVRRASLRLGQYRLNTRFNYHGVIASSGDLRNAEARAHFQFFRNGAVEVCWDASVRKHNYNAMGSRETLWKLMQGIPQAAASVQSSGVGGSGAVGLSYINSAGQSLYVKTDGDEGFLPATGHPVLSFGPIEFDSLEKLQRDVPIVVAELMNDLFQAFGADDCHYLTSDGEILDEELARFVVDFR